MKLLKPSELPEDTIIEIPDNLGNDRYIKVNMANKGYPPDFYWEPFACGNCSWGSSYKDVDADATFKVYKIVSVPYKLLADIVEARTSRSGVPVDVLIAFMFKEYNAAETRPVQEG
jgi:hypothetical protein